ncbi:amino acid adenylation domain-containing protein [Streptomyces sp. NPDC094437]|uniref:non-ribosomal peptide synthetase n=1 Tax=Streptomyces sp. NPDC094437 TaxID=3366060 RepID=UPI0038137950
MTSAPHLASSSAPPAPGTGPAVPSHPSHHVVRCLLIEGELDVPAARAALRAVTVAADFAETAVRSRQEATERAVREAAVPFDLGGGPLLRVRVLRVSDRESLLLAVAHRSAFDPVTLDAVLHAHARACAAIRRGEPVPDTGPGTVRPDAGAAAADQDHWARLLADGAVLDLPTDRPRLPREFRPGGVERFTLSGPSARWVRELSGAAGDQDALCAGVAALLARHTPQRAIPLLVPVRPGAADADGPSGPPETDVVLSFQVGDGTSLSDLVAQARAETVRARAHAAVAPGALAGVTGACGAPERQPVPVKCAVRRAATVPDYPDASCAPVDLCLGTASRDLTFAFEVDDDEVRGVLEYDSDLFEPVTARRLARRLDLLLTGASENPGTPVLALPVLPPEERSLVLSEWNRTARDFPRDRTTASLFEEQAGRDPDATAVEHEDVRLSYGELNARANRLAHRLIAEGVGPDVRVGLCLPRSVEMVVCLLGILKAGGAYLPLDPEHPARRLAYVVRDASARVVLTDAAHREAFADTPVTVLCPDGPDTPTTTTVTTAPTATATAATAPAWPDTDPVVAGDAEQLAYVIYTSGSTGEPKGVAVSHRALSRLVKGADYLELGPDQAHLQLSPLTFDASLIEVWGALLNGGTLVLPPSGLPFPDLLEAALRRHRVTTLLLVSPQLHVAAERFPEQLGRVRQLMVGGDVLSPASAARLLPYLGDTRFLHVYGPTECTLFATWKPIEPADTERPTIPIGRPIANTRTYVLDDDLTPLPIGVPGQLWLGGAGLARGYLGRPELTAERFLDDPFGPPGERIYRTGDLARWLPDGNLEFLGRGDDQVKIRGYRIELGEVDAALVSHPGVSAVATLVCEEAPGGRALAAYLVGDAVPDDTALRAHLASRVPSYMVPAAFVRLDAIPLTANGKLDRKALPVPEFGSALPHAEPLDSTRGRVLALMAEALGAAAVGPDDDFFAVGGNSLLLVDLYVRIGQEFPDRALSLVELLDNRTGARIAEILDAGRGDA